MMARKLVIGTRGSKLALWQTEKVKECLNAVFPELQMEVRVLKTLGDRHPELDLMTNQGKGVFCSELEQALLSGEIDLAVHSVKDLPGELPEGLVLGGYLKREDPREVLVGRNGWNLQSLPKGACIGTSSRRRLVQLQKIRPDLKFEPIRGNVETRIKKVLDGQYDATILALAGIRRLQLEDYITQYFELEELLPAPGQGCIGVEIRQEDAELKILLDQITHLETEVVIKAERAFLKRMGGNCQSAYGVTGYLVQDEIRLTGLYGETFDSIQLKSLAAPKNQGEILGIQLAEMLLGQ